MPPIGRRTPITRPGPRTRQGEHGAQLGLLSNQQPMVQWLSDPPDDYLLWCDGTLAGRVHPSPSTYVITWDGVIINSQFSIVELNVFAFGNVNGVLGAFGQGYCVQMPQGLHLGPAGIGRWFDSATDTWETCWTVDAPGISPFGPATPPFFPPAVAILLSDNTYAGPGNPKVWVSGDIIFSGTLTGSASYVETGVEGDESQGFLEEWDPNLALTDPYFVQTEDA